jgi:putative tryptophan/tyrosine transport system ATP-binding protein
MIQLDDLHVTFNPGTPLEMKALRGIELTIATGQFVTVIGSNGAGKSTLLEALGGDCRPAQGRIHIEGQDVTQWPTARRSRFVARVFQNPLAGSCGELTVEENLALAAKRGSRRGLGWALSRSRRSEWADRLGSLGLGLESRQAICLLMATLASQRLLLLDEHTAALDPKTAALVLELTRQLVAEGELTTLMVTHSMKQALAVGDRTLMLHQGEVVLDVAGEVRSALSPQDLVGRFDEI